MVLILGRRILLKGLVVRSGACRLDTLAVGKAVNFGQIIELEEEAFSGITDVAAIAAILGLLNGHNFALGLGGVITKVKT